MYSDVLSGCIVKIGRKDTTLHVKLDTWVFVVSILPSISFLSGTAVLH